jgi:hypothetical protein
MSNDKQVNEALEALDHRKTVECEYLTRREKENRKIHEEIDGNIDYKIPKFFCKIATIVLMWLGCWKLVDLVCDFFILLFKSSAG